MYRDEDIPCAGYKIQLWYVQVFESVLGYRDFSKKVRVGVCVGVCACECGCVCGLQVAQWPFTLFMNFQHSLS